MAGTTVDGSKFNPYPANIFVLQNAVCFLRLLHIFKCTPDSILLVETKAINSEFILFTSNGKPQKS